MKTLPTQEQKRQKIGVGGLRLSSRAKELVMEVLDSDRLTAGPKMALFEPESPPSMAVVDEDRTFTEERPADSGNLARPKYYDEITPRL